MKIDKRNALWRGRRGRLWLIADNLEATAQAVRYAEKPSDLVFPTTRTIDLVNQVRKIQWEWVAERIGLNKKTWDKWPSN